MYLYIICRCKIASLCNVYAFSRSALNVSFIFAGLKVLTFGSDITFEKTSFFNSGLVLNGAATAIIPFPFVII